MGKFYIFILIYIFSQQADFQGSCVCVCLCVCVCVGGGGGGGGKGGADAPIAPYLRTDLRPVQGIKSFVKV